MVYCGLTGNSKNNGNDDNSNDDDDSAEVFLGVDDARLIKKIITLSIQKNIILYQQNYVCMYFN